MQYFPCERLLIATMYVQLSEYEEENYWLFEKSIFLAFNVESHILLGF